MRPGPRSVRLVAVAAAAALAAPAAAYVRSTDKNTGKALLWPMPVVPYHVSSAPSGRAPSCSASTDGDPALDAARAAFSAWQQGCANIDLVFGGQIDDVRTGIDGTHENLVVFRNGFCSANTQAKACMDSGATDCGNTYDCFEDPAPEDRSIVALTSVLYDPSTGRIVNADIEVNGWDGQADGTAFSGAPAHGWYFTCDKPCADPSCQCTVYGQAGCFYIDLQNTLTHEAGHFIGLAHPCELTPPSTCTPDMASTTMYPATTPGDLEKRSLSPDDIAGVCNIYPDGGCACGSGGAPGAIAALLAILALRPRRRSAMR